MRDSLIIYRSFYEAVKTLPKTVQAEVWTGVMELGLNFNEIELTGTAKTIFGLIKPQIEANTRRYKAGVEHGEKGKEHGVKGGRPLSPNPVRTQSEPSNVNDNVNDNVNGDKTPFGVFWEMYGKKIKRLKCEKIWARLTQKDKDKIMATLKDFLNSITDKKYLPHPSSYLNMRRWEDELVESVKQPIVKTGGMEW